MENIYWEKIFREIFKKGMGREINYPVDSKRHILNDCSDNYDNNHCKLDNNCCSVYSDKNRLCYRAQCYETSRLVAKAMNLKDSDYEVAFQSRLETRAKDPWLKPYSDVVTADFPKKGIKNVLAFSPSFIADCLETTIEVGDEFKEIFLDICLTLFLFTFFTCRTYSLLRYSA